MSEGLPRDVRAGQAAYTRWTLARYDLAVLGVVNRTVWRCGTRTLLRNYQDNVGGEHLEIGVGTGYFLDRCRLPVDRPRIVLVDLNQDALTHTMRRLARYRPQAVTANALDPLPLLPHSVDSVALNYLLHCVPGDADTKGAALGHAARAVKPGGRVFGATILSGGVRLTARARLLQRFLNAKGVFHNDNDHLDALRAQLERHFADHTLAVHGCVAVFSAHT